MSDQAKPLRIKYKLIYLPILAFVMFTATMPILGNIIYWFAAFLVFCCLSYRLYKGDGVNKAYFIWVVVFFSFFLLSRFWALNHRMVEFVLVLKILPILVVTFSVSNYIKTLEDVYDILKVFYVIAIFILAYLLLFVDISSIEERMSYDQLGENWNTNSIGIQFTLAIYCGVILFWRKSILVKIMFILASLVMIYVIMITGSRKALLMFLIPIMYFLFFSNLIKLRAKLILLFVSTGFIYILFSIPYFYDIAGSRIMDMINIVSGNPKGGEDASRLFLILYGWIWFKERIWLGYGINNFRVLSNSTDIFAGEDFYAHCNYIELLVGVGIIGTLIYYSGYFYLIGKAVKQKSTISNWVIALFLTLLFIDIAQVTYYGFMYMLFISIGFSAISLKSKHCLA